MWLTDAKADSVEHYSGDLSWAGCSRSSRHISLASNCVSGGTRFTQKTRKTITRQHHFGARKRDLLPKIVPNLLAQSRCRTIYPASHSTPGKSRICGPGFGATVS
jgi:hypothetical protein